MYTVYVLQDSEGKLYKGFTIDLARRLSEHRRGKTKTTRNMHDLRIVYTEIVLNRIDARKRELYLKSAAGRRFLKSKFAAVAQLG
jgi:putative endonuclease